MRKPIIIGLIIISIIAINGHLVKAASLEEAHRHLEQGNALHKAGKFKEAAQEYKTAWEKAKLLDACYNLALVYDRDLNENEEAVKYYNQYLAADPYNPEVDNIRQMVDSARLEINQSGWWYDRLKREDTLKKQEELKKVALELGKKEALVADDKRAEDTQPGLAHVCLGCHAGFMGPQINMAATHPVGRIPKGELIKTVPKNVRFYRDGAVICLSCHNPTNLHFEVGTPGINYKYLRVDTDGGKEISRFCAFCHSSKASSRSLPEGEKGRERRSLDLIQ
ncbi:MAG: tetratricopeptide repeat protein [Candidatus Schekmanbacteria bacterium]|nr:tetratricopeptide repeat protein [Candidatus Schekmanbacteria bacterium]